MTWSVEPRRSSAESTGIRVALGQGATPSDEYLAFARQLGLSGVQFNTPLIPGERRWELPDLIALRERCESYGLRLEAIENVPNTFYEKAMLGLAGRDEEIENLQFTIRNLGKAGIPILGYNFLPGSVWRTSIAGSGRGGALVSGFDLAVATDPARSAEVFVSRRDRRIEGAKDSFVQGAHFRRDLEIDDEAMWSHYRYFIDAIAPVAVEAGVRLALHPDDPPVPTLGGIARIFRSVDALKRALEINPSPALGLDLCLGTVSEMGGEASVLEAVEYFGKRGQIVYVHFRDVRGTVPRFEECFLGEGNYDPLRVMQALRSVDFTGFVLDDHVPHIVNDSDYSHRGRAHAIGLIQGLLSAVTHEAGQEV